MKKETCIITYNYQRYTNFKIKFADSFQLLVKDYFHRFIIPHANIENCQTNNIDCISQYKTHMLPIRHSGKLYYIDFDDLIEYELTLQPKTFWNSIFGKSNKIMTYDNLQDFYFFIDNQTTEFIEEKMLKSYNGEFNDYNKWRMVGFDGRKWFFKRGCVISKILLKDVLKFHNDIIILKNKYNQKEKEREDECI